MWHEARRQEKKIRGLMVDYKKRAERRREFYEKIKADPAQFVRAYGRPCKINLDPAIALAAESPQSMMPWQGHTDNMIDRFDVRAHLDILPEEKTYKRLLTPDEEEEERKANYESYRILVENECAGLTEEQALHQLYLDEQFGAINKDNEEEKSKLKDKKAAIGFTYEDSTPAEDKNGNKSDDDESIDDSDEDIETLDLDITLDVDTLTKEQMQQLNQCGVQFGMGKDDYVRLLRRDKDEQEALRQAKLLEEEKAQFAGRKSRRERRAYKEKKLAGRALSPPSYAARDSPKYEPYKRSPSRSRSRSKSPRRKRSGKKLYITSFGGNDSDDDTGKVVQGPALPPEMGPSMKGSSDTSSENKQPVSWRSERLENLRKLNRSESPVSPRSKDKSYRRRRSRTRSRSRSRSRGRRSRDRHSRDRYSRDRSGRRDSWDRRSRERRSYSRNRRSRDRLSRERRDKFRRSRSRSRSDSRSRKRYSSSRSRSHSSRSSSRSSSSSSRTSRSGSRSRSRSRSVDKQPIKRYRRDSLSSKSSDSETEERSRYRRSKNTSSHNKNKSTIKSVPVSVGKSSSISQPKLTAREKLKRKMQLALTRQFKADKKADQLRLEKLEQEKMDREEELRQRTMEMRKREREKRHKDNEENVYADSSDEALSRLGDSPRKRDKDSVDLAKLRDKEKEKPSERKIDKNIDTDRSAEKKFDKATDRSAEKKFDKEKDRLAEKKFDKDKDRPAEKKIDIKEEDRRRDRGGRGDASSIKREKDESSYRKERISYGQKRDVPKSTKPEPSQKRERYSSSSRSRSRSRSPKIRLVSY